jgi:hypothetical protein
MYFKVMLIFNKDVVSFVLFTMFVIAISVATLCYIFPGSSSKVCHALNYTFFFFFNLYLIKHILISLQKEAIENHTFFNKVNF